jgi:cytochrome c nitrite reductase small subunit
MSRLPLLVGIAAFVVALAAFVIITDAPAYMGSDPTTCNNCHVMDGAYENWYHAGHRHVEAECVDCHLPHENVFAYYFEKGRSGMHDVFVFSTGQTPQVIRASESSKRIIQSNCIRCHQDTVESMLAGAQEFDRYCWDCHRAVAHGERGISIVPRQEP